jgi:hypothetical protein
MAPARTFTPAKQTTVSALLDLDNGKLGDFPSSAPGETNPFEGMARNLAWMQEQGFDLEVGAGALNLVGMEIVPLERAAWETIRAGELISRFQAGATRPSTLAPNPHHGLPLVVGFRTRERGMGVLRVEAFETNPMRAILTYRLVPTGQDSTLQR